MMDMEHVVVDDDSSGNIEDSNQPKADNGYKSVFTHGEPRKGLDLHAMVLDSSGTAALIHLRDLPPSIMRICEGLRIHETGEVIKPPRKEFAFPDTAPIAQPLHAYTRYGFHMRGHQALVWFIGATASNGFSIPSKQAVDLCYIPTATPL
jgi:hypothetical protein